MNPGEAANPSPKWKLGDVVRLKSGGPTMTVKGVDSATDTLTVVECSWFEYVESRWTLSEEVFYEEELVEARVLGGIFGGGIL